MSNVGLFMLSMAISNACLLLGTVLSKLNIISSYSSRKMVHISLGFSQLMLWGYYSDDPMSRVWGCMGCIIYAVVFFVYGMGYLGGKIGDFLIATVCRNGDYKEMMYGPLNYCLTLPILTLIYWRNFPPSIIGMTVMLTGDGMAEVVGKMFKTINFKTPWGRTKTLAGIISVFLFGAIGAMFMCWLVFGEIYLLACLIGGIVGAAAEFYSPPNYDNVFIPLSCVVVGHLFY
ncbi:Phosphatidate cytidylyltransferase [Entamoeba marina]